MGIEGLTVEGVTVQVTASLACDSLLVRGPRLAACRQKVWHFLAPAGTTYQGEMYDRGYHGRFEGLHTSSHA